jgi:hypothetical protein
MVLHAYNSSTQENNEFEASLGYIVRLSQKMKEKKNPIKPKEQNKNHTHTHTHTNKTEFATSS